MAAVSMNRRTRTRFCNRVVAGQSLSVGLTASSQSRFDCHLCPGLFDPGERFRDVS